MRKQPRLCLTSACGGVLYALKVAERYFLAVVCYSRHPKAVSVPSDTLNAGSRSVSVGHVFAVLLLRCRPKIAPSVIRFVPVNVVNLIFRPRAGHVEPCQSVSVVDARVYFDRYVPIVTARPGALAGRAFRASNTPREKSGVCVVVENLADTLYRYARIGSSHAVASVKGQGVVRAAGRSQRFGGSLIVAS